MQFCQKIAGEPGKFVSQASHAVIVLVDCRSYYLPANRHQPYLESGAAIQNMLLYATSIGVDSIWLNWAGISKKNEQFRKKYAIQQYMLPVAMVLFGYRASFAPITPVRKKLGESICFSTKTS
jgi:nitroreductase